MRPSFLSAGLSGILFLYAVILFISVRDNITDNDFKFIVLIFLSSIFFGIHSINHAFEEIYFNFNPLTNKWCPEDEPRKKCNCIRN